MKKLDIGKKRPLIRERKERRIKLFVFASILLLIYVIFIK